MTSEPLIIRAVSPEDWPETSQQFCDLTHEQSLTYSIAAAARVGARAEFMSIETAAGTPLAAMSARVRKIPGLGRGIAWIPSGPLILSGHGCSPGIETLEVVLDALRNHYVRKAGHILRLRLPLPVNSQVGWVGDVALRGFALMEQATPYRTVLIDLTEPEDTLWKNLHGKWRNPLRNAMRSGIGIDYLPFAEGYARFLPLYDQVRQAKGFEPDIGPGFYKDLTGPDFEHDTLIAHKDGSDIGAITIGRTGRSAVYLFGATPEIGRKLNAGHLLMWQAILHAAKQGCEWLDLGGISETDNPSVARFKRRTGGDEVTASGPYEARAEGMASASILMAEQLVKWYRGNRR